MFPESFAEFWIDNLTQKGEIILDPFCGRGTTPFQALLMERRAIACDVNDVAVCLTRAKTLAPIKQRVASRLQELEANFDARSWWKIANLLPEFFQVAYAKRTLQQLCFLRSSLRWKTSRIDSMIAALVLGAMHGEMDKSSSYLSNQMPRTISTKPGYSVRFWRDRNLAAPERNVFDLLANRLCFRYASPPPAGKAIVIHADMRELPRRIRTRLQVKCVITSPPYLDVTNFEEDQWLRLWFLGGPDHPVRARLSRDDRHTTESNYWQFIADMWRSIGAVLAPRSDVVIRIGSRSNCPEELLGKLVASAVFSKRKTQLASYGVSALKNRQTDAFRPGSRGCLTELDCHLQVL